MSDAKLRELERRWRETSTVEDEAAYLMERVRTGELPYERLTLAAYLQHRASSIATPPQKPLPQDTSEFFADLSRWGTEVLARSCVAMASDIETITSSTYMQRQISRAIQAILYANTESFTAGRVDMDLPEQPYSHTQAANEAAANTRLCASTTSVALALDLVTAVRQQCRWAGHNLNRQWSVVMNDLIAFALGHDPLPALLARLTTEARP